MSAAVIADTDGRVRGPLPGLAERWLADGTLDVAVPMAYTTDTERFERLVGIARRARRESPDRVWAGIGAYMNTAEGTLRDDRHRARRGLGRRVVLFSYDWAVGEGLSGDPGRPAPTPGSERAVR